MLLLENMLPELHVTFYRRLCNVLPAKGEGSQVGASVVGPAEHCGSLT